VPIEIWSSQLGSGNTHKDLKLEGGRRTKEEGGRRKEEGRKEGGREGRRQVALIKSRGPRLTSGK